MASMDAQAGALLCPEPYFTDPDRSTRLLDACASLAPLFQLCRDVCHVPGLAYGVVSGGELIFTGSLGSRCADSSAPPDADSVFRIASMTKSFTALAIMMLRDAGCLALDSPAAAYAPELRELRYPTADTPPLTVRDLLTMSAGWPQDDPWADRQLYRTTAAMDEIYRAGLLFSNPPGVTFEYSNYAYMLLGRIITRVAGIPATDYITRHILHPLGMTASVWQAEDVPPDRLAHGYRWQDNGWCEESLLPTGSDVAAFAGLFCSVRDLARWVALFMNAWPPRSAPETGILRRSSLREMQQAWRSMSMAVQPTPLGAAPAVATRGYGYGLSYIHNGQWPSVGHGGGLPGFGSHMRWAPDHDIGVVVLANVTYAGVHQACEEAVAHLISAAELPHRAIRLSQPLADAQAGVNRLIQTWDDALADALFAENFFLDEDRHRWQQHLEQLRQTHGGLQPEGPLQPENWLRGRWRMTGKRGWCWVWISLAPTPPARVQALTIDSVLPPSPAMQTVVTRLAALTVRPSRRGLARLLAPDADCATLWERVQLVSLLCGPCEVTEVIAGDGGHHATFYLSGPKGCVEASLTLTGPKSRLLNVEFHWPKHC
jgi:CubicO group peptidase (beta-lactamase class C family)